MYKKIKNFKKEFKAKKKFCSSSRLPFFEIAAKYLPKDPKSLVVDIGCGHGLFSNHFGLDKKYERLYLLDGNKETVKNIKGCIFYKAPDVLPFERETVDFIHCSHMIEHLYPEQFIKFLKEADRVLAIGGVFVVSSPMLWPRFYEDVSHIRPYDPKIFSQYLGNNKSDVCADDTYGRISDKYEIVELAYRYKVYPDESFGSKYFLIELILKLWRRFLLALGFRKFVKNGYTIVLKKH